MGDFRANWHVAIPRVHEAQRKSEVKGQHHVTALEVCLAVEIRGGCNDPPATRLTMHVPDVVTYRAYEFGSGLLDVRDRLMRLVLDVRSDLVLFAHFPGPSPTTRVCRG